MEIDGGAVVLRPIRKVTWQLQRSVEPITAGIPLPAGFVTNESDLALIDAAGSPMPLQAAVLDRWPDGSARWVLVDSQVGADVSELRLTDGRSVSPRSPGGIRVVSRDPLTIDTGRGVFTFGAESPFPFGDVSGTGVRLDRTRTGTFVDAGGRTFRFTVAGASLELEGTLRSVVRLSGKVEGTGAPAGLVAECRVELFAGLSAVRFHLSVANARPAQHDAGQWPLGDAGSILIKSAAARLELQDDIAGVGAIAEFAQPEQQFSVPFEIYQEASGGSNWNSPVHRNRDGVVPQKLAGYRVRSGKDESTGARATPIVSVQSGQACITLAVPQFWQQCPRAIAVDRRTLEFAFFPGSYPDLHELQGGERKTHVFAVDFGGAANRGDALSWCHEPRTFFPSPDWCASSGVVPFLTPAHLDHPQLGALIAAGLDGEAGFVAKRERFDEYGWRHFGDLPADHESAFLSGGRWFVSHYNNQYDSIAAFGIQFMRSGDARWFELMDDLARHVRDIDIYHTEQDKAAYCRGLFWHTTHYTDAGTSTHRAYPRGGPGGGGPSAEHNYNAGLMLHFFLTGQADSRRAALDLADWVLAMDDGRRTVFRFLARGATGLASATASPDYHGPGRGAGNSIMACAVAYRLTGDARYSSKALELIRRCASPADDLEALNLRHIESRWSYTVFLQVLAVFLHERLLSGSRSADDSYVRETILHYARWMARHERLYLDRVDELEFPTETWAAQDIRKADVLWWAAHLADGEERKAFQAKAAEFFERAVASLAARPTRSYTRPLVLTIVNGFRAQRLQAAVHAHDASGLWPAVAERHRTPKVFRPQKRVAFQRARVLAVTAGLGVVALALYVTGLIR